MTPDDNTTITQDIPLEGETAEESTNTLGSADLAAGPPTEAPKSREEMRARIFSSKPKSEIVEDFFGCSIEIRQPSLQVALENRQSSEQDRIYTMLTDYAFVPGTDELLFSFEDVASLRGLPFGAEFQAVVNAVNRLLGIDMKEIQAAISGAEKSA